MRLAGAQKAANTTNLRTTAYIKPKSWAARRGKLHQLGPTSPQPELVRKTTLRERALRSNMVMSLKSKIKKVLASSNAQIKREIKLKSCKINLKQKTNKSTRKTSKNHFTASGLPCYPAYAVPASRAEKKNLELPTPDRHISAPPTLGSMSSKLLPARCKKASLTIREFRPPEKKLGSSLLTTHTTQRTPYRSILAQNASI